MTALHRAIALLDVVVVAAFVVCLSALVGGPVQLQLIRPWTADAFTSGVAFAVCLILRHVLEPEPNILRAVSTRVATWWATPSTRQTLGVVLVTRSAVFLAGWLAMTTVGPVPASGPAPDRTLASLPSRWDSSWYLGVAAGGYRWDPGANNPRMAFFPGFPVALRMVAKLLHLPQEERPWLWTGVALSLLCFWFALQALHRFATRLTDRDAADWAVWLIACYPFSLFYGQLYTESLFLLAVVASCDAIYGRRPASATAWGVVAGLVRPTGCLLMAPVAWRAWVDWRAGAIAGRSRIAMSLAAVAAPVLGLLVHTAYVKHITGQWLAWMSAQSNWGRQPRNPWTIVTDAVEFARAHGVIGYVIERPYDCVNGAAAFAALIAVVPVARRFGPGLAAFVFFSLAIPLTAGGLLSIGRFTSVLFPVFIWLGAAVGWPRTTALVFACGQLVLASLFFTDRPIF